MRRRIFALISVLSLLLCAAVVVLWVHGRSADDQLLFTTPDGRLWWMRDRWGLVVNVQPWPCHEPPRLLTGQDAVLPATGQAGSPDVAWYRGGLYFARGRECIGLAKDGKPFWARYNSLGAADHPSAAVPYLTLGLDYPWALAALLVMPLVWLALRAKAAIASRRRRPGCCAKCGYDLRASPDRCPECGAPTPFLNGAAT